MYAGAYIAAGGLVLMVLNAVAQDRPKQAAKANQMACGVFLIGLLIQGLTFWLVQP